MLACILVFCIWHIIICCVSNTRKKAWTYHHSFHWLTFSVILRKKIARNTEVQLYKACHLVGTTRISCAAWCSKTGSWTTISLPFPHCRWRMTADLSRSRGPMTQGFKLITWVSGWSSFSLLNSSLASDSLILFLKENGTHKAICWIEIHPREMQ